MTAPLVCPCDAFVHPRIIANPPGRDVIDYRAGDFTAFRRALLLARSDELALAGWHPTAEGDLALQLVEWWAYLADVLTFYNERAIHEALLRTAAIPADVARIIRLLGYRPRPAIGATGVVAALVDSPVDLVVPGGFPIEGAAPPPGTPAQVFETDDDVTIGVLGKPLPPSARFPAIPGAADTWRGRSPRDARGRLVNSVRALAPIDRTLSVRAGSPFELRLDGVVMTLKAKDVLVLLKKGWDGVPFPNVPDPAEAVARAPQPPDPPVAAVGATEFALAQITAVEPIWDALGHAVTKVSAIASHDLPLDALRQDYRAMKATKLAHLWLYHVRYPGSTDPSLLEVSGIAQVVERVFDPLGLFTSGPPSTPPQDPRVLTGLVATDPPPPHGAAHLEAITRGISPGDPVLIEQRFGDFGVGGVPGAGAPGGLAAVFGAIEAAAGQIAAETLAVLRAPLVQMVKVTGYSEEIWYANAPQMDRIGQGPPVGPPGGGGLLSGGGEGPIPIPHSKITFAPNPFLDVMAAGELGLPSIVVHYGWQEVGQMVDPPAPDQTSTVDIDAPPDVPPNVPVAAAIRDANGSGAPGWLGASGLDVGAPLVPPLEALVNLLPVSRGQTVGPEILGSGDPILINQEFVLRRSPLTYLTDTGPRAIDGYRSTLRVRVDGIEWREVATFYDQPGDARIFVTREDADGRTHVRFGDGENGARLTAGVDNVVATYRYGAGAAVPTPHTLTSMLRPIAGLQSIADPIGVGGGADPDPPEQIRRYAPRSVLTYGRAVSGDDYETLAAQTPGVRRARAYWSWDGASQRSLVKVYVGDDDAAVTSATAALEAFADPNRPVVVALAAPIYPDLSFALEVDPDRDPAVVADAVASMLLDPGSQPFGRDVVRVGQVVYDSHIYDACRRIDGVLAVRNLQFGIWQYMRPIDPGYGTGPFHLHGRIAPPIRIDRGVDVLVVDAGERHSPGEGSFYLLVGDRLHITAEAARHGR